MKKLTRAAKLRSKDFEQRRLSFVMISKDNDTERFDWDKGKYIERLDINGARFDALNTLFTDHEPSVDNAIAKIENIRMENDELVCDCIFGSDDRSQSIYKKYESGILSDVSIGYIIKEQKESKENGKRVVLVTDFEIFELSAVWRGADSGAKKRAMEDEHMARIRQILDIRQKQLILKERLCQI